MSSLDVLNYIFIPGDILECIYIINDYLKFCIQVLFGALTTPAFLNITIFVCLYIHVPFQKVCIYHIECQDTIPLRGEVCHRAHLSNLLSLSLPFKALPLYC